MWNKILFTPPVAFILMCLAVGIFMKICKPLAAKPSKDELDAKKAYACGEDTYNQKAQPDYSNFFAFAFFFTLAHVATLIVTTVPTQDFKNFVMAAIYISACATGLYMLFRR